MEVPKEEQLMSRLITILFTLLAVVFTMTANPQPARADLPPAAWHCASQSECLVMLRDNDVQYVRKGLVKETITGTGSMSGTVSYSEGWMIVNRVSPPFISYMYETSTGNRCDFNLNTRCYEGVVMKGFPTPQDAHAYIACPEFENLMMINLVTCALITELGTMGPDPRSVTKSADAVYVLNSVGQSISVVPMTDFIIRQYPMNLTGTTIRYDEINDRLLFRRGIEIYEVPLPLTNWTDSLLVTLPQGPDSNDLDVIEGYALMSSSSQINSYLYDLLNINAPIVLPVIDPSAVALSDQTAFVISQDLAVKVRAYDLFGVERSYSPIEIGAYDIAYAVPTLPPVCNNGLVEPGETCDGSDFDGDLCSNYGNYTGGNLACSADCQTIFTSGCWSCGDGTMNPGESCDGTDFGGATCQGIGYEKGDLSCNNDCTVSYSGCSTCGNGLIEGTEQCEGADLQGSTCETAGFATGSITCDASCTLDTSECSMCGNSVADVGETCDGTDTPGIICQTYPGATFTGGTLGCNTACSDYDTSGCYTCGDGNVDPTEECDGANLSSQTCESLGYTGGTLACFNNCTLNITGCSGAPAEICGNNVVDALEECDDGNRTNGDGCDENCRLESLTCGDLVVDSAEDCDGTELDGATCQTIGYDRGVLFCGTNCRFNSSDCKFDAGPQTIIITPDAPAKTGDLSGELLTDYNSNLQTLTPGCVFQDLNGDLGVTVETGRYCNVEGFNPVTKDRVFFHLYIPQDALDNEPPVVRFYTNGAIAENLGGQIKAVTGLEVRTIVGSEGGSYQIFNTSKAYKVNEGKKFLSMHPDPKTPIPGRWLRVVVDKGSSQFCTDESATNCAVLVGGGNGVAIINLDELENMNQYVLQVKDSGGCNTSGSSNFFVFPFLVAISLLLAARRRKTKARPQR